MTEQIKNAIEYLEDVIGIVHRNNNDGKFSEVKMAIRSLQAWSEVLQELENMRDITWQDTDNEQRIVRANAWDKIEILNDAIDIIKQKLAEIEEGEEYV